MHNHVSEELERKGLAREHSVGILYALGGALGYVSPLLSLPFLPELLCIMRFPDRVRTWIRDHSTHRHE